MSESLVEKTLIRPDVVVETRDDVGDDTLVGIHATLKTYIFNMEGVSPDVPVATYVNKVAAALGHDVVVAETTRTLVERNAVRKYGVHGAVKEGAL